MNLSQWTMARAACLPVLAAFDIEQATQLVQQGYAPAQISPQVQKEIQQKLYDIQKHPQAWGLILPLLQTPDVNVQFFGAHTAQVKVARDWETFPHEHRHTLRDLMLDITADACGAGLNKVVLRKLFGTCASIALHLASLSPSQWDKWVIQCYDAIHSRGATPELGLDFLVIAAEEVSSADFIGAAKSRIQQSLRDCRSTVIEALWAALSRTPIPGQPLGELRSALKALDAWIAYLQEDDVERLIPLLIRLLDPVSPQHRPIEPTDPGIQTAVFNTSTFVPTMEALEEVMSKCALSDSISAKSLTQPLLAWCYLWGGKLLEITTEDSDDHLSRAFCKLLVAIGDHSTTFLAQHLISLRAVSANLTRAQAIQRFLVLLLTYTGLPGFYGVDEEESELTLGFWYLFQEALWSASHDSQSDDRLHTSESDGEEHSQSLLQDSETLRENEETERAHWVVVKAIYAELVKVLRRKVVWPGRDVLSMWTNDQKEKFRYYRRDVGDTLINAYYVLRDEMLEFYVNHALARLPSGPESQGWEEIEATLACVRSIQEAVPVESNQYLARIFGDEILGRLPHTGADRVRRTMLGLLGTYASWFTTEPALLMPAIAYVVAGLHEPALCLTAANALRDLCDANRTALTSHIRAFGQLHAGMDGVPDTEKSKVLQSIASVIQALPPEQAIAPVEAIVRPVVEKLVEALHNSAHMPQEARTLAILQLVTLSALARGLTRTADATLILDDSPEEEEEADRMRLARESLSMLKLREDMFNAIRSAVDIWSTDAGVSEALSELFKSITCLPSDTTLISLPAAPLLELVCFAAQRHLTAVWLSLASMLIIQLDPPSLVATTTLKSDPNPAAHAIVTTLVPVLLQTCLANLGQPGYREANPDVVQSFFVCMDTLALHFLSCFFSLPPGALDALLQCTIAALSLQERYSLVSACTFLSTFINRTSTKEEYAQAKNALAQTHGRAIMLAVLNGFAGVAPRSANPNLIEIMSAMMQHFSQECKMWIPEVFASDQFVQSKAGQDVKDKFYKALISSRSVRKTREAAQQFTLAARGLEGSSFGYATVSM